MFEVVVGVVELGEYLHAPEDGWLGEEGVEGQAGEEEHEEGQGLEEEHSVLEVLVLFQGGTLHIIN